MNSSKAFEEVVEYLESVIRGEQELDYNEIGKIALCPAPLFQRIFMFVSGISIVEYVRKRRLTLAAHDLQTSESSVLDIAIAYGF